jgi:hypothetical protein
MKFFPHSADSVKDCLFQIACHRDSIVEYAQWQRQTQAQLSQRDIEDINLINTEVQRLIDLAYQLSREP